MFCRIISLSYLYAVDIKKHDMTKAKPEELNYESTEFEPLGFFVEYLIDGRLIGTRNVKENPNGKIGYESTEHYTALEDIIFKPGKKIKKGQMYYTRIYPLCGRVIKS